MASKKQLSGILIVLLLAGAGVSAQDSSAAVEREFERATQLHQSGDLQGAVRAYVAILATHPARVDVRSNLGAAYSELGRYEDAIKEYKRSIVIYRKKNTIP
jgi:tetratricopeptide (TPR) repeat protein